MKKTLTFLFIAFFIIKGFSSTVPGSNTSDKPVLSAESQAKLFAVLDSMLNTKLGNSSHFMNEGTDNLTDIFQHKIDYDGHPKVKKAREMISSFAESNFLDKLVGNQLLNLPIGIRPKGSRVSLFIPAARVYANYAELEIMCSIQMKDGSYLIFGSDNIKFSNDAGFFGDIRLGLYGNYPVPINSKKMALTLKGFQEDPRGNHSGCYVVLDCDGFKEIRIDAAIDLSRDWVIPSNSSGQEIGGGARVRSEFGITVTDLNDFVVDLSFTPFMLKSSPDVVFILDNAVFDFSELHNAPGFKMPPYISDAAPPINQQQQQQPLQNQTPGSNQPLESTQVRASIEPAPSPPNPEIFEEDVPIVNTDNLWKGLYFKQVGIMLPKAFNRDSKPITVIAEDLYIDRTGVTGLVSAKNLILLNEGKMDTWNYSLDGISLQLVQSKAVRFGFYGKILVPIADTASAFTYLGMANISAKVYNIAVKLEDNNLKFPMWKASQIQLETGSRIGVEIREDQFIVDAVLNGNMSIGIKKSEKDGKNPETAAGDSEVMLDIANIKFRQLHISSQAPYLGMLTGGSIEFTSNPKYNNSILALKGASLSKSSSETIDFNLSMNINLMDDKDGGAKTGGTFAIQARLDTLGDGHRWRYEKFKATEIAVDISIGEHVWITGYLQAFSDEVYGSGFRGGLNGGFVKKDKEGEYAVQFAANAYFGNTGKFRYWYFDGFIRADKFSIEVIPGILSINGIGGGAYHNMKMDSYNLNAMAESMTNPSSGLVYVPDNTIKFGFKVSVGITNTTNSYDGIVTIEMAFNEKTIDQVYIFGVVEFVVSIPVGKLEDGLTKLVSLSDKQKSDDQAAAQANVQNTIRAALFMNMDFNKNIFQGSFKAFINAADGSITGNGSVDILLSKGDWHLYIGGYSDNSVVGVNNDILRPVSASINFGSFAVQASVYFLTGNNIPGAPPIDPHAAAFFKIPVSTNNRDGLNTGGRSAANGAGFAFGAGIKLVNTYVKVTDCLQLRLSGGAGFDLSLLKYQEGTACSISGHSPHGANNWRAGGRIYVYVAIDGTRPRLVGKKCRDLNTFKAGILMEGDVPRPSYFQARVVLELLNFIKVNAKLAIGEECGLVVN